MNGATMATVNVFDEIQRTCREFRQQLRKGLHPRIEAALSEGPEDAVQLLFENLLHAELEFRRREGQEPDSAEYVERFPQFASVIRQAFFESTLMTQDFDVHDPGGRKGDFRQAPQAKKIGEYEILGEIGKGGFGTVFRAKHLTGGHVVALKTLPASGDAERLHLFRREFRTLSEINHPNLVGMQTLEVSESQWFLTMDLVQGVDFLEYVCPQNRLDEKRLRVVLQELIAGLLYLHERGVVHRDLKPSNVMVQEDGHVVILDFGLVVELQQPSGETASVGTRNFAGTPRYAAPEQATGERTSAVDWYALGVMLYEALTGETPFRGSGIDLLIKKQTSDPPRLAGRDSIPRDLAEFVDLLIQKHADDRPNDETIASRFELSEESTIPNSSIGDEDEGDLLSARNHIALVGRDSELLGMERVLDHFVEQRQPKVLMLSGRSGEGKTLLAESFLKNARSERGVRVFAGRCYDRESVPFKAVDCWLDPLVSYLRKLPDSDLEEILPADVEMLVQIFPVLRRVKFIAERTAAPSQVVESRQVRYQAFAVLRDLLTAIGKTQPVILFIDDLQWGDADSAAALLEMLRPPNPPHIMLLGTFRSDESETSSFLSAWRDLKKPSDDVLEEELIRIRAFDQQECQLLIEERFDLPASKLESCAKELHSLSNGNPYLIEQLLESVDPSVDGFQMMTVEETIARRLARLPEGALEVLEAVTIAGQAVRLAEVQCVLKEETAGKAYGLLTHMRSERLLRILGSENDLLIDTYHDKIREATLSKMDTYRINQMHLGYADALIESGGLRLKQVESLLAELEENGLEGARTNPQQEARLFDIAHHLHASAAPGSALYQLLAGMRALGLHASAEARTFLTRAEIEVAHLDSRQQYVLWYGLGRVDYAMNDLSRSESYLEKAHEIAAHARAKARAHAVLGSVKRNQSHFSLAIKYSDSALALLKRPRRQSRIANSVMFLMDTLWLLASLQGKTTRSRIEAFEESRILTGMVTTLFDIDSFAMLACNVRNARRLLSLGNAGSSRHAYANLAGIWSITGLHPLAKIFMNRCKRVEATEIDTYSRGFSEKLSAFYYYLQGQLREAMECCEHGFEFLNRAGEHMEGLFCAHVVRHSLFFIGDANEELKYGRLTLSVAQEVGGGQMTCWGSYDVASALARLGRLAEANHWGEKASQIELPDCILTPRIREAHLAFIALQSSDYKLANSYSRSSLFGAARSLALSDFTCLSLPLLFESIAGSDWTKRRSLVGSERSDVRRAKILNAMTASLLPNHKPHILRAMARLDCVNGQQKKAIRRLEKSVEIARAKGMLYPLARSLLDLSAISEKQPDSLRAEAIKLLKKSKSTIPEAESWLLGSDAEPSIIASFEA